ncbi:MAG: hypothetical protein ACRDP1_08760 [Nocardioidaceae bacterium]
MSHDGWTDGSGAQDFSHDADQAFDDLVAAFNRDTSSEPAVWPAAEDVDPDATDDYFAQPTVEVPPNLGGFRSGPVVPDGVGYLPGHEQYEPDNEHDHFVPPAPPPVPRPQTITLLVWGVIVGGPTLLVGSTLTGRPMPQWLATLLMLGFVAGVVTLIARLDDGSGDADGPDNGAVV